MKRRQPAVTADSKVDTVDSDAFVLRVDAAGQTEHVRTWGSPVNDIALAIAADTTGKIANLNPPRTLPLVERLKTR